MAQEKKADYIGGDIEIPVRIINMFKEKYNFSGADEELINKYIYELNRFSKQTS